MRIDDERLRRPAHRTQPDSAISGSHASLLRWANLFVAAAVFLAPYASWRVSDQAFVTISDALFVLAAGLLVAAHGLQLRPFGDMTSLWMLAFAFMMSGLLVGSAINGDPVRWLIVAAQYSFSYVLLPIILMHGDQRHATYLAKTLLAGIVLLELVGAILYYSYAGSYDDFKQFGFDFITGARRLGSFVGDANWNGALVAMALPFALYLSSTGSMRTIVTYPVCLVLALGLMLSGSFTGFTSAIAALATFLLIAASRRSVKLLLGFAVIAGLIFVSGFRLPTAFESRVATALEHRDMAQAGTYTGRMNLIREAWEIVDDTTLVGLGVDQYRVISRDKAPVHNMYLLVWAEGGLVALLGWVTMMMLLVIGSARVLAFDRAAAALGFAVTLTFLIFSIAAPHMYARIWVVPLLAAMSVVFAQCSPRRRDANQHFGVLPRRLGAMHLRRLGSGRNA